jgi:hypothetical protein
MKKAIKKITIKDYIKAVKKADREADLEHSAGWKKTTSVHKSKKVYDRNRDKKSFTKE